MPVGRDLQLVGEAGYNQQWRTLWDTFNIITMLVYSGTSLLWYELTSCGTSLQWQELTIKQKKNNFCMEINRVQIRNLKNLFSNVLMIFVCKLPINKIKGYLYSILSLSWVRQIMVLIKTVSKTKCPLFYIKRLKVVERRRK